MPAEKFDEVSFRCSGRTTTSYLDGTEATKILLEKHWLYHEYCVPDSSI
jgi:hypothetical protein